MGIKAKEILLKDLVDLAVSPSPWDIANRALYGVCREFPEHTNVNEIVSKVWLIGRTYAAAIERRRNIGPHEGDAFYTKVVGPRMKDAGIDSWIKELKKASGSARDLSVISIHSKLTRLFEDITHLNKRSLASKYLHFHFPEDFYIYDSRAVSGARKLSRYIKLPLQKIKTGDREYRNFYVACKEFRRTIHRNMGKDLSPRQIDNLLLKISEARYQFKF